MTEAKTAQRSAEREALEQEAKALKITVQKNASDENLRALILDKKGVMKLDKRATLLNQLEALGWPMDQLGGEESIEDLEAKLKHLKKQRAKLAEKKKKAEQGAEYGKMALCTVLPMGDDRISTGVHIGGLGKVNYDEGDEFTAEIATARALKERGFITYKELNDA